MIEEEIRKGKDEGNLIMGFKEVMKGIESRDVEKVILAGNCPEELKESVKEENIDLVQSEMSNKRIGTICGKPFNVSVLGVSK